MPAKREFTVVIERDAEGYFVGSIPELTGCHSQGRTLDELMARMREAALLRLEDEGQVDGASGLRLVGVQRIEV